MPTAQEQYTAMLRTTLRPRLRELGFTGSGQTFSWPSERSIAQVGLQKSRGNDRNEVWFTANVTALGFDESAAMRAAQRPPDYFLDPANEHHFRGIWQRRIGLFLPEGIDNWWVLHADGKWQRVADEFVAAISDYVLPELRGGHSCQSAPL